jgi:hypothetical protein
MKHSIRKKCIFCGDDLNQNYFKVDLQNYVAHYSVNPDVELDKMSNIPFNVCVCDTCKTPQLKYLGDLNEIYKLNHADSTGTIMNSLHQENLNLILKYKDSIKNVIEIGSSKGVLADLLTQHMKLDYYIIEPSYFGNIDNKIIISDFYENVDDSSLNANTMIISHVFEHFYEPMVILDKITKNNNIENFFLVFPDLEYYINNNVLHVLNTEHTYYVDNEFLVKLLKNVGFELVEQLNHKNHSVIFYFKRTVKTNEGLVIDFENKNYNLDKYFSQINDKVSRFNKEIEKNEGKNIYIWPASIHSLYLLIFGLKQDKLSGFLDNSKNKIGEKMYGTDLKVFSFKEKIQEKNDNTVILINGGVFNKEIENQLAGVNYVL